MGKVPGKAEGFETGPAAIVNGKAINPGRKHSNHAFFGPGYPIVHPGIFPHHPEAKRFALQSWLERNGYVKLPAWPLGAQIYTPSADVAMYPAAVRVAKVASIMPARDASAMVHKNAAQHITRAGGKLQAVEGSMLEQVEILLESDVGRILS
jgi:hypothetical protein